MQKRIIAITLSVALVLCSSVSVFAANGDTVDPVSSSGYRYQLAQNGTISYSVIISKWADMVTHITQSIAYSADYLRTSISTVSQYLNTYLFSNASTGYYLWDWTPTGGVYQGAPMGSQSVISQLRNMGTSLSKMLSYNTEYAYQLYQLLLNGGLVDKVKVDNNPDNGFNQSYLWKRYENGSVGSFTTYRQLADGTSASATWGLTNHSAIETIGYILTRYDNSFYQFASGMIKNWKNADVDLYNEDLTTTKMGTSGNSFWYDFRKAASNISMHLARLDFVLASDDEIAARQAAEDNQNAFVDNFLDGSGSGSASTSDLGDMADGSAAIKAAFSSNASATDAFNILSGDGDVWDWFTQGTKDSFDNVANTRSSAEYTNYYQAYMDQVYKGVNEDNDSR